MKVKTNWQPCLMLKSLNVLKHKGLAVTGSIPAPSSSVWLWGHLIQGGKAPQSSQSFSRDWWDLLVSVTPLWQFSVQRDSGRGWSQGLSVLLEMGPEVLVLIFRAFSKLGLGFALLPAVPKVTATGSNFIVRAVWCLTIKIRFGFLSNESLMLQFP